MRSPAPLLFSTLLLLAHATAQSEDAWDQGYDGVRALMLQSRWPQARAASTYGTSRIAKAEARTTRALVADLCWLDEEPWEKGRRYLLKQGSRTTQALIDGIVFVREMTELAEVGEASGLKLNDIASVKVKLRDPILADTYAERPATGAFVLIDAASNQTAAAGMIREAA